MFLFIVSDVFLQIVCQKPIACFHIINMWLEGKYKKSKHQILPFSQEDVSLHNMQATTPLHRYGLTALLLLTLLATTGCRSHKQLAKDETRQLPHATVRTERRDARIDLDNARTFMNNATSVRERYHFRDLNGEQLAAATKYGITPVDNREQAERLKRKLNLIESNRYYLVDNLTHSIPYLTDGAQRLLEDIGKMFQHSLIHAGYRPHRIIVTSLLRTRDDVERLRQVNDNAARNSSHMYGTTFDLSYSRYNRVSMDGAPASNDVLAAFLGEVIYYLRERGRCCVIYERNQHCFHITVQER